MENDLLLDRYVAGLKMVVGYSLYCSLSSYSQTPVTTANTNFGQFAYPTIFLVAFLANSAIAIISNAQNYKYLLPVSIGLILLV